MKEGILNYLSGSIEKTLEHNRQHPEVVLEKRMRLNIKSLRRCRDGKVDTEGNRENEREGNGG